MKCKKKGSAQKVTVLFSVCLKLEQNCVRLELSIEIMLLKDLLTHKNTSISHLQEIQKVLSVFYKERHMTLISLGLHSEADS